MRGIVPYGDEEPERFMKKLCYPLKSLKKYPIQLLTVGM